MGYVRLRQVCLAADSLCGVEETIGKVLGLEPCFHDPAVAQFGLENALFAIKGSFLEVVAPTRPNTAVERFLERSRGKGGYMAIFDCSDLDAVRARVRDLGVRIACEMQAEHGRGIQLHPADVGAVLLEIDQHTGGEDRFGPYAWAGGTAWLESLNNKCAIDLVGVEMVSSRAIERSTLWAKIFDCEVDEGPDGATKLPLEFGTVVFRPAAPSAREAFVAVDLAVGDVEAILARARQAGLCVSAHAFEMYGVLFRLTGVADRPAGA